MTPQAASDSTSAFLLQRARHGDARALSALLRRHIPALRRWAHGRLPRWMRSVVDTDDLVQDVLTRTMGRIGSFESRGQGALGAYLREAVRNRIRDEQRRIVRRPLPDDLGDDVVDPGASPLDEAIAREARERYLAGLAALSPSDRELIVGHVELGYSHQQLGCMTERTPNAARMALHRAVCRLAQQMRRP
jgi:RNA polymerase sigma factor (sigma-70 family)